MDDRDEKPKVKVLRKITKVRLKNIALYYVQRFETSTENLRQVLCRRINDYARQNKEFDKEEAYGWAEEVLSEFQGYKYLDDSRFAEIKIRDYLAAGKSERYIRGKMTEKGIADDIVEAVLAEQEFDPFENAMRLAKKKRIGPYRPEEERAAFRQKDMGTLARAGFELDVVKRVLDENCV